MSGGRPGWTLALALLAGAAVCAGADDESFVLRGRAQTLHRYGRPGGRTAIVTSGDGGWVHLGPEVAQFLAGQGFSVVGFDAKAYLSSFTSGRETLAPTDVPRDYAALVGHLAPAGSPRPILFGVSEGAGLSVLAATDPELQARVAGVVALGLPDKNELGWRFRDSVIYFTKKTPDEPLFSVLEIVGRVRPVPLAVFQSAHDEFVPPEETRAIFAQAGQPKRLWPIDAADHRFSDRKPELQKALLEAIEWIGQQAAVAR